jgi:tRNA nucleotidyltransferase (CCA-adding enzyme)
MKVYLVGGAVRDQQLEIPVTERDWCVVGATPDDLERDGYKRVGKDFPVFLHAQTGEEYALARTERKTAAGYHGFSFNTSPDITIEEDLERRDLTINAMAIDDAGKLVDPYGGQNDIREKKLRHVSDAFSEDPVRVLRVAKFAARFAELGFEVAPETMAMMKAMVGNGEVDALVPDRVWKETQEALAGRDPHTFFAVLRDCGALRSVYPEIDALFGVPQPAKWHPEIDCGVHTLMVLQQATLLSRDADVRFAALVHDLGKATTPKEHLPSHNGHERRSVKLVRNLCQRLPVPKSFRELGLLAAEFHGHCHRAFELRPETVLKVLERTDAFRREDRFEKFLLACEADARGRTGFEGRDYPQANYLRGALAATRGIAAADIAASGADGAEIGAQLRQERARAIGSFKASYAQPPK